MTTVAHRVRRTEKLRRSWTAQHTAESPYALLKPPMSPEPLPRVMGVQMVDDSLTSLNWLQNLNIMKLNSSPPPSYNPSPTPPLTSRSISLPTPRTTTYQDNLVPDALYNRVPSQIGTQQRYGHQRVRHQATPLGTYEYQNADSHNYYNTSYSYNQQPRGLYESYTYNSKMQVNPNSILNVHQPIKQEPELIGHFPKQALKAEPLDRRIIVVNSPQNSHRPAEIRRQNISSMNPGAPNPLYTEQPLTRPHYSFATLICMALQDAPDQRLTLPEIQGWILENFPYYRTAEPRWQQSVRHNLSLNKCFQRIPRKKEERSRGGSQWTINPDYRHLVDSNVFKKRRQGASTLPTPLTTSPPAKRSRGCSLDEAYPLDHHEDLTPRNASLPTLAQAHFNPDPSPAHISESILNFGADSLTDALDMSWSANALLSRDLDLSDLAFKAEDLLDESAFDSPPPSDTDSELALEEFLRTNVLIDDDDIPSNPLDLTVHGTGLRPPEWWVDLGFRSLSPLQIDEVLEAGHSGLHTPTFGVPCDHPWAENKSDISDSISSLDTDLLENDFKPFL